MRAHFASFTLDSATRELLRGEEAVHISTKAFDVLQQLIESRPRVLAKDEILEKVWPATHVGDGTLAAVVAELRGALADDARNPRFIRTVHRVGYAFCGNIAEADGPAQVEQAYRLVWGAREIQLGPGPNVLGRDQHAVAWIDDPSISRRHAVVHVSDAHVTIEDLGSKNGTFLKGTRVRERQPLHDGDAVTFGRVQMIFRIFSNGTPTESVNRP
jgi:DNA-binding winged helix-turn-helix (wHTH) protein